VSAERLSDFLVGASTGKEFVVFGNENKLSEPEEAIDAGKVGIVKVEVE